MRYWMVIGMFFLAAVAQAEDVAPEAQLVPAPSHAFIPLSAAKSQGKALSGSQAPAHFFTLKGTAILPKKHALASPPPIPMAQMGPALPVHNANGAAPLMTREQAQQMLSIFGEPR